ncbi:uncharacterized protein [Ptychodera flava]|uniref:uncharacterized protein n=1 Tax=Ptychodera flava TaxID=63121 RepID=UPI003969C697
MSGENDSFISDLGLPGTSQPQGDETLDSMDYDYELPRRRRNSSSNSSFSTSSSSQRCVSRWSLKDVHRIGIDHKVYQPTTALPSDCKGRELATAICQFYADGFEDGRALPGENIFAGGIFEDPYWKSRWQQMEIYYNKWCSCKLDLNNRLAMYYNRSDELTIDKRRGAKEVIDFIETVSRLHRLARDALTRPNEGQPLHRAVTKVIQSLAYMVGPGWVRDNGEQSLCFDKKFIQKKAFPHTTLDCPLSPRDVFRANLYDECDYLKFVPVEVTVDPAYLRSSRNVTTKDEWANKLKLSPNEKIKLQTQHTLQLLATLRMSADLKSPCGIFVASRRVYFTKLECDDEYIDEMAQSGLPKRAVGQCNLLVFPKFCEWTDPDDRIVIMSVFRYLNGSWN